MRYLIKYLNKLYIDKSRKETERKLHSKLLRPNVTVHESLVPLVNFISYLLINQQDDIKEFMAEDFIKIFNTEERQEITNKFVITNNTDWLVNHIKRHKDIKQTMTLQDYVVLDEKKQQKVSVITFAHWFAYIKETNTLIYQNILHEEAQYPIDTLSYLYFSFFPLFQDLSGEAKFAILNENQWFVETLDIDFKAQFLEQERKDFSANLKKIKVQGAENKLRSIEQSIQDLIAQLNEKYRTKEKTAMEYLYRVDQGYDEAMSMFFGYLSANENIAGYEFTSKDTVKIFTKPLYMEFVDEQRLEKAIPSFESKKLQNHLTHVLEGQEVIGLGEYEIVLTFKKQGITHSLYNKQRYIYNGHQGANCLGTFEPPIVTAKNEFNLVRLLDILFQYLQAVNVADSAGQGTFLNKCYFKDIKTGNVTYTTVDSDSVKADEVENEKLFLERRLRS